MKTLLVALGCLVAGRDAKDDVKAAATKLADAANYGWTSTVKSEGGGQGNRGAGPTEGKAEKDGYTLITTKSGEASIEAVIKGAKAVLKTQDGWKSADEFAPGGQGGQRDPVASMARRLRTYKAPAAEAADLVGKAKEIKDAGEGALGGDLTEEGVKALLSFGGRPGGQAPQIADAKGSIKFWIKEGVLVKYEYNVQGKATFGQREVVINRTTTVEIKEVGSTKIEVSEDAKKKLG